MQACRLARAIVVTLTPFAVGALAPAQTILEEVVVSAQKREQNIQDVGIAIAAFTGDQLLAKLRATCAIETRTRSTIGEDPCADSTRSCVARVIAT